ncbi:hypothetical protein [Marinigracilibium pacificum]|uniref:DUF2029 domain-containing protein n=1 Tax=Marinigracilibium pacificum TaxID=2729599 RepID=A0A848J220_9BACT|nr:hypothetical protein [Marinigracilibium pacificum]NMM47242.1 hypothetical protein [Marinigracilibium pacificum]
MKRALILVLLAMLVFLINNLWLGGYLYSIDTLAVELMTTPESLTEFRITNEEPFKFRIVFQGLVKETSSFINPDSAEVFYYTYLYYSLAFFVISILSFFYLFKLVSKNQNLAFIFTFLILISPAYVMAYSIPVHTREDTLAYALICLGLIALLKNQYIALIICIIIATATRETTMILPLSILFYPGWSKLKRFLPLIIALVVFVSIRVALGGKTDLDHQLSLGLRYNLNHKLSSLSFPIITLHIFWVYYLIFIKVKLPPYKTIPEWFSSTSVIVLIPIFLSTIVFGRLNEIRLLTLATPWVMAVILLNRDKWWVLPSPKMIIFVSSISMAIGVIVISILKGQEIFTQFKQYYIPYSEWTGIFCAYGILLLYGILKLIISYRHEYQKVN